MRMFFEFLHQNLSIERIKPSNGKFQIFRKIKSIVWPYTQVRISSHYSWMTYKLIKKKVIILQKKESNCYVNGIRLERCSWFTNTIIMNAQNQWYIRTETVVEELFDYTMGNRKDNQIHLKPFLAKGIYILIQNL